MKQIRFNIYYDGKFSYSFGYYIYSAFLESIDKGLAEKLHNDGLFTQYITPKEWVVNTTEDLDFSESYFLSKFNIDIRLGDRKEETISEQEMANKFLIKKQPKRNIKLRFLTPTTFKKDGEYVMYPTSDLIMQSLTNKWNMWAKDFVLEDMEWNECKISKYNLRSQIFQLKGVKIQGFVGEVELYFWGSESIIRLGNMVCTFANYSGTGIKAALGMGGTIIE